MKKKKKTAMKTTTIVALTVVFLILLCIIRILIDNTVPSDLNKIQKDNWDIVDYLLHKNQNLTSLLSNKELPSCYGNPLRSIDTCVRRCDNETYYLYLAHPNFKKQKQIPVCDFGTAKLHALISPHTPAGKEMICPNGKLPQHVYSMNGDAHLVLAPKHSNVFYQFMTVIHSYLTFSKAFPQNEARPDFKYLIGGFLLNSNQFTDFYQRIMTGKYEIKRLLFKAEDAFCFKQVITSYQFADITTSNILYANYSSNLRSKFSILRNTIASEYKLDVIPVVSVKRVCLLSREAAHTFRGRIILNEQQLLEHIQKHGYLTERIVIKREKTLDPVAALMNPCDSLVAMHGAGLANVVFLKPSAVVIELFPHNFTKQVYEIYAQLLSLQYHAIRLSENASIETDHSKATAIPDYFRWRNVWVDPQVITGVLELHSKN